MSRKRTMKKVVQHNYEGIVNMVLRWFNETTSEAVRSWAEKFMVLKRMPCVRGGEAETGKPIL